MSHPTPNEVLMSTLRRALSLRRPHDSFEEGELLLSLAFDVRSYQPRAAMFVDAAGNLHVDLRTAFEHRTLFVAHVDTVHWHGGVNAFDDSGPIWRAMNKQPLGADDGAGVAMLAALISAGVPAYYVFTRGEEAGGVGARHLADYYDYLLSEFDRAIAFDRRDIISVITHQSRGRCCSDAFAEALTGELNELGMLMMPDDTGVYTDTAEFIRTIPECTNISAGYYYEHSDREELDTVYLQALLAACLLVRWDHLPTERDPSVREPSRYDRYMAWQKGKLHEVKPLKGEPGEKGRTYIDQSPDDDVLDDFDREALRKLDAICGGGHLSLVDLDEVDVSDDRPAQLVREIAAVQADDAFAWSDDGKTFQVGYRH